MSSSDPNDASSSQHGGADVSRETPPSSVDALFGERVEQARAYVRWLESAGIERGLMGPREMGRLWSRHVLNCSVVGELIPHEASLADVGSGAGLPGIPIALARPDLHVTLVEPLLRRADFLNEVVDDLALSESVSVVRSRAEDLGSDRQFDAVTARAVAPMGKLATWTLPLVRRGGILLAMKGESVDEELRESSSVLETMGATSWTVQSVGVGVVEPPTVVAVVRRDGTPAAAGGARPRGKQRRKRR